MVLQSGERIPTWQRWRQRCADKTVVIHAGGTDSLGDRQVPVCNALLKDALFRTAHASGVAG